LAISVINDPDIVVLDEPFSGLDPVNAVLLKQMIIKLVQQGKIVLFSSHQMSYVEEFCRHICIIRGGETVLDGDLQKIKRTYPRNRVLVTAEEGYDNFKNALLGAAGNMVVQTEERADGLLCTLRDASEKDAFLSKLVSAGVRLDAFAVSEPTLGDIFVEKAGA
jgi:ABC-2 type transport system ATP-binding protein